METQEVYVGTGVGYIGERLIVRTVFSVTGPEANVDRLVRNALRDVGVMDSNFIVVNVDTYTVVGNIKKVQLWSWNE